MRPLVMTCFAVMAAAVVAAASAHAENGHQFDGTYHLLAPAFPAQIKMDCPPQNGSPGLHDKIPWPAHAFNAHVLDGVYNGHHIKGNGSIGSITYIIKAPFGAGKVAITTSITFNSTFHSMSIAVHILGHETSPDCAITGGFIQKGRRIGA